MMEFVEPSPVGHDRSVRHGMRTMAPLALAVMPFGFAIGTTIAQSEIAVAAPLAASLLMFGGSAQLAAVQMMAEGSGLVAVVTAVLMINARFVAYGASMASMLRGTSRRTKAAMATTLVDQTYMVTTVRAAEQPAPTERHLRRHYFGASLVLAVCWVAAQVAGVLAGTTLPSAANLSAAAPISLAGLAAGVMRHRTSGWALIGAGALVLAISSLAGNLTLVLAIVGGVAVADAADRRARVEGVRR